MLFARMASLLRVVPPCLPFVTADASAKPFVVSFPTYFDETVILQDKISISAGIRGCQMIVNPNEIVDFLKAKVCDLLV